MVGLLNTLIYFYKMFADIIKFIVAAQNLFVWCGVCSVIDFLQWFMSGGCQGYVLVDDTTKT
jgi:hypothetical protein